MTWQCPDCGRSFGRYGQPHGCAKALPLDDWLGTRTALVREVVMAVQEQVRSLGDDVLLEATASALMINRSRTFAEVKPHRDCAEIAFILSRRVDDPRVSKTLDAQLVGWLTEACASSPVP